MLLKCLVVICSAWGVAWGCRPSPPPANKPPNIDCPSVKSEHIADSRETTTSVSWSTPKTSDPEKKPLGLRITTGKVSGDKFGRGSHSVTYVVTDAGGLTNTCSFSFSVKVIQCRPVQYIRNGRITCDGYIYGMTCDYMCDQGYKVVGKRAATCQKSGKWSSAIPQCVAMECPVLKLPKHGLDHICTKGRKFESICWLTCDEKNGYAPARGQWTRCTKDQTWTNLMMTCEDEEPPTIHNCPQQTILQTKETGSDKTEVVWPTITVTDNSNKVIALKSTNTDVSKSGGTFFEGTELVKFTAEDAEGNRAEPCFFIVRVLSVSCEPPSFDDEYLQTPGCIDFQEGNSCTLRCYLAIRLIGKQYITCKKEKTGGREIRGYWDWGQFDTPPAKKPFCQAHNCTDLRSPDNGAIVCDDWTKGEQCQLQCNEDYDIPESVSFTTNLYLCSITTGKWNNVKVPDCTYREYGEKLRLPEYYYFYGSCSAAKAEIINNFLLAINENQACPEKEYCTIENVNVRCGDETEDDFSDDVGDFRRKRSIRRPSRRGGRRRGGSRRGRGRDRKRRKQYINFNIVINTEKQGSFSESFKKTKNTLHSIAKRISKTKFTAGGRVITAARTRVRDPVPVCRPGLKIGFFNKDSCVPCLVGSYHDVDRDECVACPLGQYQPEQGQMTCVQCPKGQTTLTIANTEQSSCQVMCQPGHYSKNGVVPCAPCSRGTYQTHHNATTCKKCPIGMTTETYGASAASQCIAYDILLQGPVSVPVEGNSPAQICDFTFAVWIKLLETTFDGIKFQIYSPITGVGLELAISSGVKVYLGKKHHVYVPNVIESKWVHVSAVWSKKKMTVYIGGKAVHSEQLSGAPKCPSPTSSVMRVAIRDHAYMYLRDLNFLTEAKPSIITKLSMTCNSYLEKSLFTLEQLDMQTMTRVNEVLPSTCLRPDVCSTKPCGKNVCIPRMDNFTCACRGGYSGEKCEIAPDLCKDNICDNNATCLVVGSSYRCDCRPGYRGKLCEDRIADGGWSEWQGWSGCTTSCGNGTRVRHRFCTNPPPDRGGKTCSGPKNNRTECHLQPCPECDISTLIVGKGIKPSCKKKRRSFTCTVKCVPGKVFPEQPFTYKCTNGIWTPTRQTVSCTDPVTPLTAGINYTVVFDNSINTHSRIQHKLEEVGRGFQCSQSGECSITVGSAACSQHVQVCDEYDGDYYGSLIVEKEVPAGGIDIRELQKIKQVRGLFDTWNVFTHTSEETFTPEHRALEMSIQENALTLYPFDNPSQSVEVPGQFGSIMKTWKYLDDTNWEVRNDSYTDFDMMTGRQLMAPNFLSARQVMTCPPGAVQGGVFCIKCPPGKMYVDGQCRRCRHGFYQDQAGMSNCKACPGLQTTELLGNPSQEQCIVASESRGSTMKMLLGISRPGFGVFDFKTLTFKTIDLEMTQGNVDYLTYSQRDGFIYYATQSPPTIGRIGMDGMNEDLLFELPSDTHVTGLDVDVGSGLIFYTTSNGVLAALHVISSAEYVILSNLTRPRGLTLDQQLGIYWVEGNSIMNIKYSSKVARTVVSDTETVWRPILDKREGKIIWQSFNRLRNANLNGSSIQTLANHFSSRFGLTEHFYFHIAADGRLMRINKDLTATVSVSTLPDTVVRMWPVNTTDDPNIDNLCSEARSDCDQGCFPVNETYRHCFCAVHYTLQKDYKTCRQDFSVTLNTSDPMAWAHPSSSDYAVPPSMTLRLKVKSCHSARLALAETTLRMYRIELGQKRGNVTEVSIKKMSPRGYILLKRKEVTLLDCTTFKSFWITWKEHVLKVGAGEQVGKRQMLMARENRPYNINYVLFGTGLNATAIWQF